MGEIIDFPQQMTPVDTEVEYLIGQAEEGGAIVCVIQNESGDITVAFEPWPAGFGGNAILAMNKIINRFRDSKDFREALCNYAWNVGGMFKAGAFSAALVK